MKLAIIITILGILSIIVTINTIALANSVSEFDLFWEDENYGD